MSDAVLAMIVGGLIGAGALVWVIVWIVGGWQIGLAGLAVSLMLGLVFGRILK